MLVREPPSQVAAVAALFKAVCDEIVVAVDSRVDPATLGPLESVADQLWRVEHTPPFARTAPWLHAQARGPWVMVVDGDEVPSVALLERLAARASLATYATHAHVGRRWVWPDDERYLTSDPWRHNPSLRITPRDSRLLHWHHRLHDQVRVDGPGVYLPEVLYHLDTILLDERQRREKVTAYDALRRDPLPGFRGTVNAAWYLPEDADVPPETDQIPQEDIQLIRAVMSARETSPKPTLIERPVIRRATVDEVRRGSPAERDYLAEVTPPVNNLLAVSTEQIPLYVPVMNKSSWTWRPWDGERGVRLGWHWLSPDGDYVQRDAGRAELTSDVPPGERVLVPASIRPPHASGQHLLHLDLVDEGVRWFEVAVLVAVDATPGASPNAPEPELTLPPIAAAALEDALGAASTYLEFGAGGSTLLASHMRVPRVITVETDVDFLARVSAAMSMSTNDGAFLQVHVDIGPVGTWGFPRDFERIDIWPEYVHRPWKLMQESGWSPDLILIDGRFRVACFLRSLLTAPAGTLILFDDYHDRPHYSPAGKILKPTVSYGRMAAFRTSPLSLDETRHCEALLSRYVLDPR